jgi:hypothetical protein
MCSFAVTSPKHRETSDVAGDTLMVVEDLGRPVGQPHIYTRPEMFFAPSSMLSVLNLFPGGHCQ